MRRLQERLKSEEGITLIEIMVAITIIAIVIVASATLMMNAKRIQMDNESTDQGAQLARDQVEQYRAFKYENIGLPSGSDPETSDGYTTVLLDNPSTPTYVAQEEGFDYSIKTEIVWYGPDGAKYIKDEVVDPETGRCSGGKLVRTTVNWDGASGPMQTSVQSVILPGFDICASLPTS